MRFGSKIFVIIFLTTAFVIGGMAMIAHVWLLRYHVKSSLHNESKLVNLVALKSEDYILRNERIELFQFYQSILSVDPVVEYLIAEKQGEILISTFENGVPRGLLTLPDIDDPSHVDLTAISTLDKKRYHHFRKPVGNPVFATIHIGVSDEKLRAQIRDHRNLLLLVGFILLSTVPLGLAFFISRLVSKPLDVLRHGVRQLGSGQLDFRINLPTGDEIEQLAGDINIMARQLEKSRDGLHHEIISRKIAQKELAKQTEILNSVLNHAPINVFWKDKDLSYFGCNQSFAKIAGLIDPADIIGKTDDDMPWTNKESKGLINVDRKVLETGEPVYNLEEILTLENGDHKTVITSKVPLKDAHQETIGVLGIFHDITERKAMEETLKQTQKMEAIGTLAGGIAHDFNNILGGIIGYTELAIEDTPAESPIAESLKQVLKSASRAKELVRQILTFSRKHQEERRPVSMPEIVSEEAKLLRSTLPATIEIQSCIDENAGMTDADPTRMHQIVMNLCTNAAHAMQSLGGTLKISLTSMIIDKNEPHPHLSPGPYLKLMVADNGPGMDGDIVQRIFDPFFTTKKKGEGTGMGLAVVHGIVKEHGGDITVESHPGRGSIFTILLPRVVSEHFHITDDETPPLKGHERILLVDDETTLLNLGEKTLSSLGYKVTACNSSLEALDIFKASSHAFDLVITDQTMPHMTGFNMSRHILAIRPDLPIILCTGYSDSLTPEKAKGAGIRTLLYKPLKKREIAKEIRIVLDLSGSSDEPALPSKDTRPLNKSFTRQTHGTKQAKLFF